VKDSGGQKLAYVYSSIEEFSVGSGKSVAANQSSARERLKDPLDSSDPTAGPAVAQITHAHPLRY